MMVSPLMNQNGISALISSAKRGFSSVVTLLLSAGADVNHASKVSN
jgi:ankyrin repeat protein